MIRFASAAPGRALPDASTRPARAAAAPLAVFGVWTVVGLLFASNMYLSSASEGRPMPLGRAVAIAAVDVYTWALVTLVAFWATRRFALERGRLAGHVLALAGIGLVVTLGRTACVHLIYQSTELFPYRSWTQAVYSFVAPNFVSYWLLVGVAHAVEYARRFREREVRSAQLETQLTRAQLQMLKMQLHPHFLFNTLHAISTLVHRDADAAERMIASLSELLRSTLAHEQAQEVTVEEEMALLEPYLDIEKTRLGDRLRLELAVEPSTREARVPHLILQPLIENAIRHGLAPRRQGGTVRVSTVRVGDQLAIRVQDDGRGFVADSAPRRGGGVGLSNTRARLEQLYGPAHHFQVSSQPDAGTRVDIRIPFRVREGAHELIAAQ